jgi:hypothetical protein
MNSVRIAIFAATTAVSLSVDFAGWADTRPNPYLSIADRNPFGIRPPPPAPPPVEAPAAIVPLAKVVLTGVTSMLGPPRALLEITEQEPGKAASIIKRVLKEGEKDGSIEVLSIDVANNKVRIRNGTVETNVGFEVVKSSAPVPAAPGTSPPPILNPALGASGVPTASASPMIISPGGADTPGRAGSGVAFAGASSVRQPTPNPGAIQSPASYASSYAANRFGNTAISTYGALNPNAPNVSRPLRNDAPPGQPVVSDPHKAAMNTYIGVETLRNQMPDLPLPETPLTRHLNQP